MSASQWGSKKSTSDAPFSMSMMSSVLINFHIHECVPLDNNPELTAPNGIPPVVVFERHTMP